MLLRERQNHLISLSALTDLDLRHFVIIIDIIIIKKRNHFNLFQMIKKNVQFEIYFFKKSVNIPFNYKKFSLLKNQKLNTV